MRARRTAALAGGGSALVALATLALAVLNLFEDTQADTFLLGSFGGLSFVLASLVFSTVGTLIATRVPENRIGWILCLIGVLMSTGVMTYQYTDRMLFVASDPLPGAALANWIGNAIFPPCFGLLGIALLLFPDGRLPSRRWRPALWLALAGIAFIVVGYALRPGPFDEPYEVLSNPFGIPGAFEAMDALAGLGWLLMAASVAVAATAMVLRLRRAHGTEREQLKWIALAAAFAGVALVANVVSFFASVEGIAGARMVALGIGFAGFPLAAGAAILRYRLYDIDVVINRALVYGALTVALGGAYVTAVLVLQLALQPLTSESDLAIAGSTLAVAALFGPARARIQRAVDRRFFRRRYDATRTLEAFGAQIAREVDLDAVSGQLCEVAGETMQASRTGLWLRPARNASWTPRT